MRALACILAVAGLAGCSHKKTEVARAALAPGHGVAGAKPAEAARALHDAMVAGDRATVWYSMTRATQAAVLAQVGPIVKEMDGSDDDKVGVMAKDLGMSVRALRALPAEELAVALMSRASTPEERAALEHETITQVETPSATEAYLTAIAGGATLRKHYLLEDGVWKVDLTREIAEAMAPPK